MFKTPPKAAYLIIVHSISFIRENNERRQATVEQCFVSTNLKHRTLCEASVIVEIISGKVLKNRFSSQNGPVVGEYYLKQYEKEIKEFYQNYYGIEFTIPDIKAS